MRALFEESPALAGPDPHLFLCILIRTAFEAPDPASLVGGVLGSWEMGSISPPESDVQAQAQF